MVMKLLWQNPSVNVAGNAFQDITEMVLTMEYNTEFNPAGAA